MISPKFRLSPNIRGEQLSSDPAVAKAYFDDHYVTDTLAITSSFGKVRRRALVAQFVFIFALGQNVLALIDAVSAPELLRTITKPVFLYHGDDDTLVPPRASQLLADHAPNVVKFTKLAKCRHEAHNEACGDEIMAAVADFFVSQL